MNSYEGEKTSLQKELATLTSKLVDAKSYLCDLEEENVSHIIMHLQMSLVVRKPVFGVSDQVRHKPDCTATEDG